MTRPGHQGLGLTASLAFALLATACGTGGSRDTDAAGQDRVPGGISGVVREAFDSATAALEAGDAHRARDLFDAVLAEDSTLAAAWIGLHLASRATRDSVAADSALRRARSLIEPPPIRGRGTKPAT
jgi:Tfp pilus assembly protein PilF